MLSCEVGSRAYCRPYHKGIKVIFILASRMNKGIPRSTNHYNCPIVTSYPDVIFNNIDQLRENGVTLLRPFLTLEDKALTAKCT